MSQGDTKKIFDLEDRTLDFAKRVVRLCKELPINTVNDKLIDQVIRSAGSIGANYREASDSLGKKDELMRLKISRKEAKETIFWLELIVEANKNFEKRMGDLVQESRELKNILSSIVSKRERKA